MLQYFDNLTDISGNALLGATVQVLTYPGGVPAPIYSTNSTSSPIANSTVVADITGQVQFFAPDGVYQLQYSYQGTIYKTRAPVTIADLGTSSANVIAFGADNTGVTDSTAAIANACASLGALGGTVYFPPGQYLIASNLTVPPSVTLKGPFAYVGTNGTNASYNYASMSALIVSSSVTITLDSGSGIFGCLLYQQGLTFPQLDPSSFAGTCITINGDDTFVSNCQILGFNQAILSSGFQRPRFTWLWMDNNNNISVTNCLDIAYISDCHSWPFVTVGTAPGGQPTRSGTAYSASNSDFMIFERCFAYGYQNGFVAQSSNVHFVDCSVDMPNSIVTTSVGFAFSGNGNDNQMENCICSWQGTGITVDLTAPAANNLRIINCDIFNPQNGTAIAVTSGRVTASGGNITDATVGIDASASPDGITVLDMYFDTVTTPINVAGSGRQKSHIAYNRYVNCTASVPDVRFIQSQPASEVISTFGTTGALSMQFSYARGTAEAQTTVLSGDPVFASLGQAYNGTTYITCAQIRGQVLGTISGTAMPGQVIASVCPAASNVLTDITVVDGVAHYPATDNAFSSGKSGNRWSAMYSVNFASNATGLGFYGISATPIAQPTTGVGAAVFVAGAGTAVNDASTFDGYTLKQVVKALRNLGLLA